MIDLSALRRNAETPGRMVCDPAIILALLDVVEAARTLAETATPLERHAAWKPLRAALAAVETGEPHG